jgi:hypothetical protein
MESVKFMKDLALMHDALEDLENLSVHLQGAVFHRKSCRQTD